MQVASEAVLLDTNVMRTVTQIKQQRRELERTASPQARAALSELVASWSSPYVMSGLPEGLSNFKDPQVTASLVEQSKIGATDEIRATAARFLKAAQSSRAQ